MQSRHVAPAALTLLAASLLVGSAQAQQNLIPRAALVDMTRAHSRVICTSDSYLACMNIDSEQCVILSEAAIDQCLMKLPAEIDPTKLENETLEACPQKVYEEAGYSEEQAKICFARAVEEDGKEKAAESSEEDKG